jgi:hypothetical protein
MSKLRTIVKKEGGVGSRKGGVGLNNSKCIDSGLRTQELGNLDLVRE